MLINDLVLIHHKGSSVGSLPQYFESLQRKTGAASVGSPVGSPVGSAVGSPVGSPVVSPWFEWGTCLRQLAFGFSHLVHEPQKKISDLSKIHSEILDKNNQNHSTTQNIEVLFGAEAYSRLLEITCGLHSPLFGETEVFGQFKLTCQSFKTDHPYWNTKFQKVFSKFLSDSKIVRQKYLTHIGSQSYGSAVRKELKGINRVDLIGGGQLVKEMLPWILKSVPHVFVHVRDTQKAKLDLIEFPKLKIIELNCKSETSHHLHEVQVREALIVAAPLTADEIKDWCLRKLISPDLIIDLRGESAHDPIPKQVNVLDLKSVFARIEGSREQHQQVKALAEIEIQSLSQKRVREIEVRPFGWEDLCAL